MSIEIEYAIKKDIRNNPVIRELDTRQKREFRRIVWLAALSVTMLLFSAWQHFETVRYSSNIEQLRVYRAHEQTANRQLRLNLETLRTPQDIERRARRELGLVPATSRDTLILERVPGATASPDIVAQAR